MRTRTQTMALMVTCNHRVLIILGKSNGSSARVAPVELPFDLHRQKYRPLSAISLSAKLNDCHSSKLAMRVRFPSPALRVSARDSMTAPRRQMLNVVPEDVISFLSGLAARLQPPRQSVE